jgi:hypothetical protein
VTAGPLGPRHALGPAMPVMCIFRVRDVTATDYDEIRRRVRWEETPPPGGIAHFLTFTDGGAIEYDVWETRAAFEAFHRTRMEPVLNALGIDMGHPKIIELHGLAIAEEIAAYQVPRPAGAPVRASVRQADAVG